MVSLVSKRQQAKNERELQQLINDVPGNNRCADCEAPNPGWASWSLGIFLCMRCAGLHRKMGTHISKVKSLSMDSWSGEQVRNMKRVGNTASNQSYNPDNLRPEIPVDIDEVDGVMERFIRQKYEVKVLRLSPRMNRARIANRDSEEGSPPPLPPKPSRGIGFKLRSASSVVTRFGKVTPPVSPITDDSDMGSLPPRVNKKSRVLGSNIGNSEDDFDAKLATLRDMGFRDTRRTSALLKSMNGDLSRTIEALVRAGESDKPPSGTLTPVSAASGGLAAPKGSIGLVVGKTRTSESRSTNPFDALDFEPLPQRSATMPVQSTASNTAFTQPGSTYQPPGSMEQSLERGFSGLQVSQPQSASTLHAPMAGTNPFLASPTPRSPYEGALQQPHNGYQQVAPQPTGYMQAASSHDPWAPQQNLHVDTSQAWQSQQMQQPQYAQSAPYQSAEAFYQQQYGVYDQAQGGHQYQSQSAQPFASHYGSGGPASPSTNPFLQSVAPAQPSTNPFMAQQAQQPQQQPQPAVQQQQYGQQFADQNQAMSGASPYAGPTQQQMPFKHDKTSILALYNQPPPQHLQQQHAAPQRSVTMPNPPSAGSMNPFAAASPSNGTEQGYQPPISATDPFSGHRWT